MEFEHGAGSGVEDREHEYHPNGVRKTTEEAAEPDVESTPQIVFGATDGPFEAGVIPPGGSAPLSDELVAALLERYPAPTQTPA